MMTGSPRESLRPTRRRERIRSLDLLRGFALLAILIINIQVFSMISAAYLNPTAYGDLSGVNGWVYVLSHVLADQKFMTLFTILYGAGIVLMTSRAEARGSSSAAVHYRRTFILLVIGLLHAYLLWAGDVLVSYALCALVVFPFRKLSPRTLLTLGLGSVLIASAIFLFTGLSLGYIPPDAIAEMMDNWKPSAELVQKEVTAYRSGWLNQMEERVGTALFLQTKGFLLWGLWRVGGLMLVGMALFKWGVVTAARSSCLYVSLAAAGLTLGWALASYGLVRNFRKRREDGSSRHRLGDLDGSAHRLFLVGRAVSLRAHGMGVALVDLWEAPANPIGTDSRTGGTLFTASAVHPATASRRPGPNGCPRRRSPRAGRRPG